MSDSHARYRGHSDQSLLGLLRGGDERAASEIFSRHSARLLAAARTRLSRHLAARVDEDDIIQSTFRSFFRRAGNGGYSAPRTGDLFNLLIVIAMRKVNARADYHQAGQRDVRRSQAGDDLPAMEASDDRPLRELCLTIDELCSGREEAQRQIVAFRLEGFSIHEIAARTGRSRRTVERELQWFREALSRYFEP
jgi:RNA polymerase sigma-70 factor, ECF subfamily